MIFNKIEQKYYKYKILTTFSVVTILLVVVISKVSYDFVYNLYLDQLSENVKQTAQLTVSKIDEEHKSILSSGIFLNSTKKYFDDVFADEDYSDIYSELFIFNKKFEIMVHSDNNKLIGVTEPRLFLSENEIISLDNDRSFVSLPFKGNDNNWYLWCFYKFSEDYFLAVRSSASRFESIENFGKLFLIFGIIGLTLSVISSFIVAKSISEPISKLVKFSANIGKGNFKTHAPENMKGELKILADSMDLMRENISNNQKEKEKILAQIAHEIRNPLGGIELLTNLVDEKLIDNCKEKEYTKTIIKEINGLKELITSYLNFSRPTKAEPENLLIKDIVHEALMLVDCKIQEKNIRVSEQYEIKNIVFDRSHFKNIIINLLSNSIDAVNSKGEIIIESFKKNKNIIITFSDNGIGIPKENLNLVFEPFFTTKNDGTGLGLASCKKYCDENIAKIIVNKSNLGCSFSIIKENIYE
jgi:signal transduction histidine kinase